MELNSIVIHSEYFVGRMVLTKGFYTNPTTIQQISGSYQQNHQAGYEEKAGVGKDATRSTMIISNHQPLRNWQNVSLSFTFGCRYPNECISTDLRSNLDFLQEK